MKTSVRFATPLLAVVAVTTALLAPYGPGSAAHAAPALTLTSSLDPADPQAVPSSGTDFERIGFEVATTEAASVTATAAGPGLTIGNPNQVLAATTTRATYFTFDVIASTPGFHPLTVTVTATGATPQQVVLPYVWADGTPASPSTGSLAGRTYGWQGYYDISGLESSVRDTDMISFVTPTLAYLGLPPAGKPRCKAPGKGCVAYAYDTATGLFQVGSHIVGRVIGDGIFTSGFTPADEEYSEIFSNEFFDQPLTFAEPGARYEGVWRYSDASYPSGLMYEFLTLHRNGTYALAFQVDDKKTQHLAGRYRIGKRGKITFLVKGKVTTVGTLIGVGAKIGRPKPAKLGFWLILKGKGDHRDGNLLERYKKK